MARPSDDPAGLDGPAPSTVVALLQARPASLGTGRLLCIDGPSGSGKTTLAAAVADLTGAPVVHMDDLVEGWSGLPRVDAQLDGLLRPLAAGRPGAYRRFDWIADAFAETVTVSPAPLLVLEGVGAGSRCTTDLATVLVWVEAAYDVRMRRGLERDGDAYAPYWEQWATGEQEHFALHGTRERADLVLRT